MARGDAPKGFDAIHNILGRALREADPSTWPARPHLGGPLLVMSARTQFAVGVALAAETRRLLPPADPAAFDALHSLAVRVNEGEPIKRQLLDVPSKPTKRDSPDLRVAKLVVRAGLNYLHAAPSARNSAGLCVANAAAAVVPAIAERGEPALAGFLAWLDAELMLHDLAAVLAERSLIPTSRLARVISRPATDKGTLALAVAALTGGTFGLYAKLKSRWEWHEGDRSTVFATVPDAFMDVVGADLAAAG